jgi:type IV pilus assembly protein PilW
MSNSTPFRTRRQRGFSLIEVLIGLLIAMIAVVIIMEALITSDRRTRTTSGANDAMSGGAIMLHMVQSDLLQAGYGINSVKLLGCNLTLPNGKTVPMAPVVIYKPSDTSTVVPAGDANTDRLLVVYGSDSGQPEGNTVYSVAGDAYTVQSPASFNTNDYVVAYPGSCAANLALTQIAATTTTPGVTVNVTAGSGIAATTTLYNLGQTPHVVAYAIRNGALTSCDYMAADCTNTSAANWTAVGGNIVSLRAQYGRDTNAGTMNGQVDTWDQTTPTSACLWARAPAVRFALVAKSTQYETTLNAAGQRVCDASTTPVAPTWQATTVTAPSTALPIDLSAASDWQCYRYRTFENVAPSRNVVWMGVQAGC